MTATLTESPRSTHLAGAGRAPGAGRASDLPTASGLPGDRSVRGGRGGGRGGAMTVDPRDRAQLAEAPVPVRACSRSSARTVPRRPRHRDHRGTIVVRWPSPSSCATSSTSPCPTRTCGCSSRGRGMVAVAVVTQLLGVVQTWLTTQVGERVMHGLRTGVFTHLQRQSIAFFTRTRSGEVQSRLTHDISGMQAVITSTATSIASNVTTAVATAVAMVALPAPVAALAARHPTGRVDDPPGGPHPPRHHCRASASSPTCTPGGGEPHGQRHALVKTLGASTRSAGVSPRRLDDLIDLEMRSQLAGRWRMATMQIIFAAIPALIYLAAGFPATRAA